MRYQLEVKEKVKKLRREGVTLGAISRETHIPKTTVTLWTKDIILSKEQIQKNFENHQKALQLGREKLQQSRKEESSKKEQQIFLEGKMEMNRLSSRELLLTGIALYWGEGFKNKHERRLGFCNSDPGMITFYLFWLNEVLKIKKKEIVLRLTINYSYKDKTQEIQEYWSMLTGIPLSQFTKPFYQYAQWKKQYATDDYHGVLRVHVKNSKELLWRMRGWIDGLKMIKYPHLPG